MGIRGLSSFVDLNHKLLCETKLHDTRVVIDGNNLYHFLWHHYRISQQFGGDYDHFSRKCKLFFNTLHKCHIAPYVIFDGGYDPDDRKLPTILERMQKRILAAKGMSRNGIGRIMPILAQETFRQVLDELEVPHASCRYEADREIAVLANKWKCPVMSNDSDFFVFGLEGGFLPFDYVNLTLCVCDAETGVASVVDFGKPLTEHQFVYIPVKLYQYEKFVKYYCQTLAPHILPIFATVLGNDYIDPKLLEGFYAKLHVPKKNNQKFSVPKLNTRMLAVLKWLDSVKNVDKAVENVLIHLPSEKRDNIRSLLMTSIEGYSNLEHFLGLDLKAFFETSENNACQALFSDVSKSSLRSKSCDVSDMYPELKDYFSNALPEWFVKGSRKCDIPGQIQNVAVLHRAIRLCLVEIMSEPSAYNCCKRITEVICGIIFGQQKPDETGKPSTRQTCLVQYDRDQLNIKKVYITPAEGIPGFSPLPSLQTLSDYSKENRMKLLISALGLTDEFRAQQSTLQHFSTLLVSIVCHWVRHATPKVTHHHMYSLLIGVIALHVRCLRWLDKKAAFGTFPVIPYLATEIKAAYHDCAENKLDKFVSKVDKFFKNPEHSSKNPRENGVIHGFSQFQTCLYETIHLNQLILTPAEPPSPSLILNSTFVYNLCRDLQERASPDLYVAELLVNNSPLHKLFESWKQAVLGVCETSMFEVKQRSRSSQKKSKSKGKKGKKKPTEANELSDSEVTVEGAQLIANCDISNKFAMLHLDS